MCYIKNVSRHFKVDETAAKNTDPETVRLEDKLLFARTDTRIEDPLFAKSKAVIHAEALLPRDQI
ncbi:hypothetical protein TRM7557_03642 [Tritonibacter multivorans]|uniref:Uncharacterized protein n=1 Tax=Tritonibacter multivorans TaxID=928856 RepID=A0A0P1GIW7_9RHOB|nr:hypothetical protein [Tritonibacter multivorans]MDA7420306.1 hypothetical protein [Tritonibacter multivorans]CUH81853.1 hypothetical protein TRM7557_03642 [Tritonibacter multivorans]SFC45152.1 hypothetical protein SAMN04488049_102479 [Tritonibacter multivorans]